MGRMHPVAPVTMPQNSYPELHCNCYAYCLDYCDKKRKEEGERLMNVQTGQKDDCSDG